MNYPQPEAATMGNTHWSAIVQGVSEVIANHEESRTGQYVFWAVSEKRYHSDAVLFINEKIMSEWILSTGIIVATLVGPIAAVQAQKWIERSNERKLRKLEVFHRLMATRGIRASPEHVQALNMIDLVFLTENNVIGAWHKYLDHLSDRVINPDAAKIQIWNEKMQ